MSFIITWNGSNITTKVISYQRSHSLCSGVGTLTIEIEGFDNYDTWDEFIVIEDGTKKATYNASTIVKNMQITTTVVAENGAKRLGDYFIHQFYNPNYVSTAKYWIEEFLTEAGVNYSFNVVNNGATINKNAAFGRETAFNLITPMLQQSGWYLTFDEDNDAIIGKLDKNLSNPVASFNRTDIIKVGIRKNDKMSRNKAIVWGGMDYINEVQIAASVTEKQNWQIDSNDVRPILVTNSAIQNYPTAYGICWQLINEFSVLTKVKEVEIIGFHNIKEGDIIFIETDVFTGAGMITTLEVNTSASGMITKVLLDERCPRIFAFFAWDGYVYAGTWGSGIYRKPLEVNSWSSYNNGLDNLFIKDLYIQNGVFVTIADDGYAYYNLITSGYWRKINHDIFTDTDEIEHEEENTKAIACTINDDNEIIIGYNHRIEELSWILHYNVLTGITRKEQVIADDINTETVITDLDNTGEKTILGTTVLVLEDGEDGKGFTGSAYSKVHMTQHKNSYGTYNTHEFLEQNDYSVRLTFNNSETPAHIHHDKYVYYLRPAGYPTTLYLYREDITTGITQYLNTNVSSISFSSVAIALATDNIIIGRITEGGSTKIVKYDFTGTPVKTTLHTYSGYTGAWYTHAIFSYNNAITFVWGDILDGNIPGGVNPPNMEDVYITYISSDYSVSTTGPIQDSVYTRKDGSDDWIATEILSVCDEVGISTVAGVIRHDSFEDHIAFLAGKQNKITLELVTINLATGVHTNGEQIEYEDTGPNPDLNLTALSFARWCDLQEGNRTSYVNNCLYEGGNLSDSGSYDQDKTYTITSSSLGEADATNTFGGTPIMWAGGTGGYDGATDTIDVWDGTFPITAGIKSPLSLTASDDDGAICYWDSTLISGIVVKGDGYTKYFKPTLTPTKLHMAGNLIFTDHEIIWNTPAVTSGIVTSGGGTTSGLAGTILRDNYLLGNIIPSGYAGFTTILSGIPGTPLVELSKASPTIIHTKASGIIPSYIYSSFTNEMGSFTDISASERIVVDALRVYTHFNEDVPDEGGFKVIAVNESLISGPSSINSDLTGEFSPTFSGVSISGINKIETSNYDLPPFFFIKTGSGDGQKFYQRNPSSSSFFENSTGLPSSDIIIIRSDDGM